jgi:hypothetical protein
MPRYSSAAGRLPTWAKASNAKCTGLHGSCALYSPDGSLGMGCIAYARYMPQLTTNWPHAACMRAVLACVLFGSTVAQACQLRVSESGTAGNLLCDGNRPRPTCRSPPRHLRWRRLRTTGSALLAKTNPPALKKRGVASYCCRRVQMSTALIPIGDGIGYVTISNMTLGATILPVSSAVLWPFCAF